MVSRQFSVAFSTWRTEAERRKELTRLLRGSIIRWAMQSMSRAWNQWRRVAAAMRKQRLHTEQQEEMDRLRDQLAKAQESGGSEHVRASNLEAVLTRLQEEDAALQDDLAKLQAELARLQGRNGELEKQLVEMPALRATNEELQRNEQGLLLAKEVAEQQRNEFELRVEGCVQMSADKCSSHSHQFTSLAQELQLIRLASKTDNLRLAELEQELAQSHQVLLSSPKRDEHQQLREQLAHAEGRSLDLEVLKDRNTQLEDELTELRAELLQLREGLARAEGRNEHLEGEELASQRVAVLEHQLSQKTQESQDFSAARIRMAEMEAELVKFQALLERANESNMQLQEQVVEGQVFKAQAQQLQEDIQALEKLHQDCSRQRDEMEHWVEQALVMATSKVTLATTIGFQKARQNEVLVIRMRKEVTTLRLEKDSFIDQLDSSKTTTFSSQQQLDELQNKLNASLEDSQDAAHTTEQLEQKVRELEEADASSSQIIAELTLKVANLESNIGIAQKDKEYFQQLHDTQLKESGSLREELARLKKANEGLEIAMQGLQLDAEVHIRKVTDLTAANTKLKEDSDQLRHQIARNEGRCEQMEMQVSELGAMRAQAQQWQQEQQSLTTALQTADRERTAFESRLVSFTKMTQSVIEELVYKAHGNMVGLRSRCEQLQHLLSSKETALSMVQGEQVKSSMSAASQQEAVLELKLHIETLTARETQMASMLTHLQVESTKHVEEVNSWKTKYLELDSEFRARDAIHRNEINQLKLQADSFSSHTQEKVKYSVEITVLQEELTKWQQSDKASKQRLAELEAELAQARINLKLQHDFEHQVESTLQLCTRAVVALQHKVDRQHHLYKMQLTRLTDENNRYHEPQQLHHAPSCELSSTTQMARWLSMAAFRYVTAVSSLKEENNTLQDDLDHLRGEVRSLCCP